MTWLHTNPFLASLAIVFFAELGDKTLYTLVVLATRNHALPVVLGGWLAFVIQGLIAVLLGSVLRLLPHVWIQWGTAAVFLGCGLWLLLKRGEEDEEGENKALTQRSKLKQFWLSFGLVFAAEFGDATQVGSAALVARFGKPVQVFLGATTGLWLGTLLAVAVGRFIGDKFPSNVLRKIAGALFVVMAVVTAVHGAVV